MIAEAVDTAVTLAQALAVLLLVCAALATATLYVLVVTVALACVAVSRGCAAALAAVQRAGVPEVGAEPQEATDGRGVPTWVRIDREAA